MKSFEGGIRWTVRRVLVTRHNLFTLLNHFFLRRFFSFTVSALCDPSAQLGLSRQVTAKRMVSPENDVLCRLKLFRRTSDKFQCALVDFWPKP